MASMAHSYQNKKESTQLSRQQIPIIVHRDGLFWSQVDTKSIIKKVLDLLEEHFARLSIGYLNIFQCF